MRCYICNTENEDDASFCLECGARIRYEDVRSSKDSRDKDTGIQRQSEDLGTSDDTDIQRNITYVKGHYGKKKSPIIMIIIAASVIAAITVCSLLFLQNRKKKNNVTETIVKRKIEIETSEEIDTITENDAETEGILLGKVHSMVYDKCECDKGHFDITYDDYMALIKESLEEKGFDISDPLTFGIFFYTYGMGKDNYVAYYVDLTFWEENSSITYQYDPKSARLHSIQITEESYEKSKEWVSKHLEVLGFSQEEINEVFDMLDAKDDYYDIEYKEYSLYKFDLEEYAYGGVCIEAKNSYKQDNTYEIVKTSETDRIEKLLDNVEECSEYRHFNISADEFVARLVNDGSQKQTSAVGDGSYNVSYYEEKLEAEYIWQVGKISLHTYFDGVSGRIHELKAYSDTIEDNETALRLMSNGLGIEEDEIQNVLTEITKKLVDQKKTECSVEMGDYLIQCKYSSSNDLILTIKR